MKSAPRGKPSDLREVVCERFEATLALKRLARMWTTPILLILLDGPRRFAELQRALAPISAKVLTQRLRELERDDLILRVELVSAPPKSVVYSLTRRGEGARVMLDALVAWNRIMRDVSTG